MTDDVGAIGVIRFFRIDFVTPITVTHHRNAYYEPIDNTEGNTMSKLKQMTLRATKLAKAIESCRAMGWSGTADFYAGQLVKLEYEINAIESFIAESAKTKGLPLPVATY